MLDVLKINLICLLDLNNDDHICKIIEKNAIVSLPC
jgi:hypothetical protein